MHERVEGGRKQTDMGPYEPEIEEDRNLRLKGKRTFSSLVGIRGATERKNYFAVGICVICGVWYTINRIYEHSINMQRYYCYYSFSYGLINDGICCNSIRSNDLHGKLEDDYVPRDAGDA